MTHSTLLAPTFAQRLLSAAASYAKFSSGAIALTMLCMASYALVHRDASISDVRDWLLPLSLVINILAVLSVSFTVYLLKRIARLEEKLTQREPPGSWSGMLQQ